MKNNHKYILFFLCCFISSFFFINLKVDAITGWVEENGRWYYYTSSKKRLEDTCKELDYAAIGKKCWFCFDSDGVMIADQEWEYKGKTYTFDENGVRSESYVNDDGMLIDPSLSGWVPIDDCWYYYKNGKPVTGLKTLEYKGGSGKFYFDEYGEMQVGFITVESKGKEYDVYFDEKIGNMITNTTKEIDGITYKFNKDGTYEELDGETVDDDEDSDEIDDDDEEYDDDEDYDDEDYDDEDYDDDSDDGDPFYAFGGGSSGSGGSSTTSNTYKYSTTVKKTSCESLNNAIDFLMAILDIIHIFVPIILILMGAIDFAKATMLSDDKKMRESEMAFIKRCLAAVIVFFIPVIVEILFSLPGLPTVDIGGIGCEISRIIF